MKTIKEARKNIVLLWRPQKLLQTVYRPMKFLLQTEVDDGLLIYNVVTSEMVLLDEKERTVFEGLPDTYNKELDELIARHYVVAEEFDENTSVRQLRNLLKKIDPPKRVKGFTILPTTECNARCYYCFESDHKRCTLTKEKADDVVEYIAKLCKGEPVEIGWFGGEPLVGSKRISQICEGLKRRDIKYKSSMVSNAYLFDENLIQIAKDEWKLTSIQITLDGTEKIYNETKAYINPKDNPYERVLKNIGGLLKNGIVVNIRLNVTDKNYADLNLLIDELADRFKGEKAFSCYSHAVYEGVGFEPLTYSNQDLVDSQTVALDSKLREKGLLGNLSQLPYLRTTHCMADNDATRLIYPDGKIGKCENMPATESIGDIYDDITDREKDVWYKTVEQPPDCEKCSLFPYCFDLKPCPEAGKCSEHKRNWKKDRYTALMKKMYQRHKDEESSAENAGSDIEECNS